jgi:DNA invertase Pin-like site-specific DNA recombinase
MRDMRVMRVITYIRVSTDGQVTSGAGLDAQIEAVTREIEHRGWTLTAAHRDEGLSGATMRRPGLMAALDALDRGEADVLMVSKLDRLSRSIIDGAQIMERARRGGWAVVALDLGVDTTTPSGEMVASVILSMSQYERRLISDRTRVALAAKKAAGVKIGRPRSLPDDVRARIVRERTHERMSLAEIARRLTAEGVPTAQGGRRWYPSTVRNIVVTA